MIKYKNQTSFDKPSGRVNRASLREGGGICVNFRLIMFSDKSANDGRRARYKIFYLAKRFATHSPSVIRDFRKRKYICFAGADDTSLPEGGYFAFARLRKLPPACIVCQGPSRTPVPTDFKAFNYQQKRGSRAEKYSISRTAKICHQ